VGLPAGALDAAGGEDEGIVGVGCFVDEEGGEGGGFEG
jgi:hypothetical protein